MNGQSELLRAELLQLISEAETYFSTAEASIAEVRQDHRSLAFHARPEWEWLTEEQKQIATELNQRTVTLGSKLLELAKASPLLGSADLHEIRILVRGIAASLRIREFEYHPTYAISEEDRVYGMVPEEQTERATVVNTAKSQFQRNSRRLLEKFDLILPTDQNLPRAIVASQPSIGKFRRNTAFIMMQIDEKNPRLQDVKNCIKDVFKSFGINAVRSDEIEHQDVLTQRILDEIATSEFLIADLTGERPSVYYEVGFAHACGKRPILYREQGTRLHFDLSVHNVPEYKNITDLKEKLTKRLEAITNKSADNSK